VLSKQVNRLVVSLELCMNRSYTSRETESSGGEQCGFEHKRTRELQV
jgi:hypothetical protein